MISRIAFIGLVLCILRVGDAKFASGEFSIPNTGGFHYLTRFGCSIGDCDYKARFRVVNAWKSVAKGSPHPNVQELISASKPVSLDFRLILDEAWETAPINQRPKCSHMNLSRVVKTISVPAAGEWSSWINGGVHQVMRPHIWYFVADDCSGVIPERLATLAGIPRNQAGPITIQWEFLMTQPSGSHFGYELLGTFPIIGFHILCYVIVLCMMGVREVKEMKRTGRLHVMLQMLNTSVLTQLASSLLHLAHLIAYSFNGYGIASLDMLAEGLAVISQIVMSSMLILIACGYTLNVQSTSQQIERAAVPVVLVVTALHVLLVLFDSFNADPRFKSHAADGFLGLVLTVLRLLLWGAFLWNFFDTANHKTSSPAIVDFLRRFVTAGSLYFLAYPLVFGITAVCPAYVQHKVITNGIFVMQLSSMVWLSSMFLTKGEYFKVSEFSHSYLPGGYLSSRGVHRID